MKLRLDRNSVRIRVKKSDLETLREKNSIHETVLFPNGLFGYRLSVSDNEKKVTAKMDNSFIEVMIPFDEASFWMNSEETGIYHTITFDDRTLEIIIEKDFPCKDKSEEANADTFIELAEKNNNIQC